MKIVASALDEDRVAEEAAASDPEAQRYYDDKQLFRRNVFWLVFGSAAAGMGVNTADALMPLHMSQIGLGAQSISFLMAIRGWYGPFLLFYIAWKSDHCQMKLGRRLPFLIGTLPFIAMGMLFFPYSTGLVSALVLYSVFRVALDVKWDAYPYLIYDIAKEQHWGRVSGVHTTIRGVGVWLGQVAIMPLVPVLGAKTVYAIATGLLVVSTVLMATFLKEPPIRLAKPEKSGLVTIFTDVWKVGFSRWQNVVLFVACSLVVSAGLPGVYVALQGKVNLGLTEAEIGQKVLQWGTMLSILLAFAAGWLIDKIGAIRAIALGYIGIVVAAFIGYAPETWKGLAMAYAIMYGSTCLTYTGAILFVVQGIDRSRIATFSACNGAVVLFMQSVYMLGAGAIVQWLAGGNYGAVFPYGVALSSIGLPLLYWVNRRRICEDRLAAEQRRPERRISQEGP